MLRFSDFFSFPPPDTPARDLPPPDLHPTPLRQTAQNFALFSLSRPNFRSFSLSLGVFSWNFGSVFKGRAAGVSHDSPRTPNVHIEGSRRFKHHQNSTRRPPEREREKERKWGREREKKREILGNPPPSGPHPSSPHAAGPDPSGPHSSSLHPSAPLPSSGGPPGLHFFWVWAPTFLIFIMLLICSFFVHF